MRDLNFIMLTKILEIIDTFDTKQLAQTDYFA